jgi:hypothetical protein
MIADRLSGSTPASVREALRAPSLTNLVIDNLDEFGTGISFVSSTVADYVTRTPAAAAVC